METAVQNYASYRSSPGAWMLGKFIVPVSWIQEFEYAARTLLRNVKADEPWSLTVIGSANLRADVAALQQFNKEHSDGKIRIDSFEVKVSAAAEVVDASAHIPRDFLTFFEVPLNRNVGSLITAISKAGACAKVRTGGVNADMTPLVADLAHFLSACAAADVPIKATAGLHHALCGAYKLTYEENSPTGKMYGFLNLFLAAAFARKGMEPKLLAQLLEERSILSIQVRDDGIVWRSHELNERDLIQTRHRFLVAFGSCSFEEPIGELEKLGLM
jgi:hypothetical protein